MTVRAIVVVALLVGSCTGFTVAPNSVVTRNANRKKSPVVVQVGEDFMNQIADFDPAAIAAGIAGGFATGVAAIASKMGKGSKASSSPVAGKKSNISIPYDAAARLAYDAWRVENDKGEFNQASFETFKAKYEQLTVANVTAKKLALDMWPETEKVDLSIPYDAAARRAYDKWRSLYGKGDFDKTEYEAFKVKYDKLAVAEVTAKKLEREMAGL